MSSTPTKPLSERYIIHSEDAKQLADFLHSFSADLDVEIIDKIGPLNLEHTAIVALPKTKAKIIQQQIKTSNTLTIEPDRPLSFLSHTPGTQVDTKG